MRASAQYLIFSDLSNKSLTTMLNTPKIDLRQYQININGHEFSVTSAHGEEHIRKVESFLNEQIASLAKQSEVYSPTNLAILAALNLADELIRLQSTHNNATQDVKQSLISMCEQLDRALTA